LWLVEEKAIVRLLLLFYLLPYLLLWLYLWQSWTQQENLCKSMVQWYGMEGPMWRYMSRAILKPLPPFEVAKWNTEHSIWWSRALKTWQACAIDEHDATPKSTICDHCEQEELRIASSRG
jgi:hypothetical protein